MKTTVNVRDDLFRRAKARAALQGKSLSRFLEESLERMLQESADDTVSWPIWAAELPALSEGAARDLRRLVEEPGFRDVDPGMWK